MRFGDDKSFHIDGKLVQMNPCKAVNSLPILRCALFRASIIAKNHNNVHIHEQAIWSVVAPKPCYLLHFRHFHDNMIDQLVDRIVGNCVFPIITEGRADCRFFPNLLKFGFTLPFE